MSSSTSQQKLWMLRSLRATTALLLLPAVLADSQGIVFTFDPQKLSGNGFVCATGGLPEMTCHDGSNWYGGCAYAGDAITPLQWCCIASGKECWRYGWKAEVCNGDGKLICNGPNETWCCDSQYEDCDKTSGLCLSRLSVFPNPLASYPGPASSLGVGYSAITTTYIKDINYTTKKSASTLSSSSTSTSSSSSATSGPASSGPSSTAATSTDSVISPLKATSSSSAAADSNTSSGLSSGAKAGLGIGIAVGVIAIIVGAWLFMRRRKQKAAAAVPAYDQEYKSELGANEAAIQRQYELMDGGVRPHELDPQSMHFQQQQYELDGAGQEEPRR